MKLKKEPHKRNNTKIKSWKSHIRYHVVTVVPPQLSSKLRRILRSTLLGKTTANVSCSNTFFFSKLCVHTLCVSQCWCSCVETLVILPAKFHVVSRLLSVLKTAKKSAPISPIENEFEPKMKTQLILKVAFSL